MKTNHFKRNADVLITGGMLMTGYAASIESTYSTVLGVGVFVAGVVLLVSGVLMLNRLIAKQEKEIADLKRQLERA